MVEIADSHTLIERFGYWPSFHDATIVKFHLNWEGQAEPDLEMDVRVFEATQELDSRGHFVLRNQTLVTICFGGIRLEYLKEFSGATIILDFSITDSSAKDRAVYPVEVEMIPSYGCEMKFACKSVKISRVVAC